MPNATDFDWYRFHNLEDHGLRLRFAHDADLAFVQAALCHPATLRALHYQPEPTAEGLRRLWAEGFDAPDMRHFIAETVEPDPVPVGYLRLLYPFPSPQSLWLSFMLIAPPHQRQGWGRRILRMLLVLAEQHDGIDQFGLHTGSDNTPARRLYESLGFQNTHSEPWQFSDGTTGERITYCLRYA